MPGVHRFEGSWIAEELAAAALNQKLSRRSNHLTAEGSDGLEKCPACGLVKQQRRVCKSVFCSTQQGEG